MRKQRTNWKRHKWTEAEKTILRAGFADGTPVKELAEIIGVPETAAYQKASQLGFGHKSRSIPLEERFMSFVIPEPNSGCWLWTGSVSSDGYARIKMGHDKAKQASHVSMSLFSGGVPDGLWALHTCDNTYCVNPDHLFAGTPQDNSDDKVRKGRWRGPDHPITIAKWRAKLLRLDQGNYQ